MPDVSQLATITPALDGHHGSQFSVFLLATCVNGLVRSTGPVFWYSQSMGLSNVRRSMVANSLVGVCC